MSLALSRVMASRSRIAVQLPPLALAIAAGVLAGCGNTNQHYVDTALSSSYLTTNRPYSSPFANCGHPEVTDFECKGAQLTSPANDPQLGTFTVFTSKSNTTDVMIFGDALIQDDVSFRQLCVFPIDVVDSTHKFYKIAPNGLPMVAQLGFSTQGIKASFPATQFNAAAVVSQANCAAMSDCLRIGRPGSCPSYVFGQFR
jgi:hypothetical protein